MKGRLYDKVMTIFGTMMVFFYLGLGIFLIFSPMLDEGGVFPMDKALRIIFGSPMILYGIYRAFTSYEKIRENFFTNDEDEE
jgi:hypothetical protein